MHDRTNKRWGLLMHVLFPCIPCLNHLHCSALDTYPLNPSTRVEYKSLMECLFVSESELGDDDEWKEREILSKFLSFE